MTYTAEIVVGYPHETGPPTFIGATCDHQHKTQHAAWMCAAKLGRQNLPSQREAAYTPTKVQLTVKILENR